MTRVTIAVALIALTTTAADARRYHQVATHHGSHARHGMAWCGLYMRSQVGGDPGASYNLARNWAHWGAPSSAGVGAVVVWQHHVGIIVGQQNGQWIMRSGNDGGRVRTRPLSMRGVIAIRRGGGGFGGAYAAAQPDRAEGLRTARGRTGAWRAAQRRVAGASAQVEPQVSDQVGAQVGAQVEAQVSATSDRQSEHAAEPYEARSAAFARGDRMRLASRAPHLRYEHIPGARRLHHHDRAELLRRQRTAAATRAWSPASTRA